MVERATCPTCGVEVRVKRDGSLWAHRRDGVDCPGSGVPAEPAQPDSAEQPAGDVDGVLPGVEPAPEPELPELQGYVYRVEVKAPCPYLNDPGWHAGNQVMAARAAAQAGHQVAGEARYAGASYAWDGRTITLTYQVPVR